MLIFLQVMAGNGFQFVPLHLKQEANLNTSALNAEKRLYNGAVSACPAKDGEL